MNELNVHLIRTLNELGILRRHVDGSVLHVNRSCSQHRIEDFSSGIMRELPDSKATESAAKNHIVLVIFDSQFSYSMIHS